jgi:hypothetical protein
VSRGLRVAAAGALVAAWAGVGSSTSGAATTLVVCDKVASTALADDGTGVGIAFAVKDITVKVKGLGTGDGVGPLGGAGDTPSTIDLLTGDTNLDIASFKGGNSAPCSGPLNQGPLTKLAGKLTGKVTCDANSTNPNQYPLNGKLSLTYTNINPATGKPFSSLAYVRTNRVVGGFADEVSVHGIATKGVAVGADVDAHILFQPYTSKLQPFPQELLDAQSCNAGGPGTIENLLTMTDSYTLGIVDNTDSCFGGLGNPACHLDGNIQLSFP